MIKIRIMFVKLNDIRHSFESDIQSMLYLQYGLQAFPNSSEKEYIAAV